MGNFDLSRKVLLLIKQEEQEENLNHALASYFIQGKGAKRESIYLKWTKLQLTKFFPSSIVGHVQEVNIVDTWDLNWSLETHEKSGKRPFLRLHVKQILPFKHNTASGHLIIRMPNKNLQRISYIKTFW